MSAVFILVIFLLFFVKLFPIGQIIYFKYVVTCSRRITFTNFVAFKAFDFCRLVKLLLILWHYLPMKLLLSMIANMWVYLIKLCKDGVKLELGCLFC